MNFSGILSVTRFRIFIIVLFYIFLVVRLFLRYSIYSPDENGIYIGIANLLLFLFWGVIFLDMLFHRIQKKLFWLVIMLLLPYFSPLFYLFGRRIKTKTSEFNFKLIKERFRFRR